MEYDMGMYNVGKPSKANCKGCRICVILDTYCMETICERRYLARHKRTRLCNTQCVNAKSGPFVRSLVSAA